MANSFSQDQLDTYQGPSILLVSDRERTWDAVHDTISKQYAVTIARDEAETFDLVERKPFDCALVEMERPDEDTNALIEELGRCAPSLPIMVFCSAAEITSAVEAIRAGAVDFVIKEVEIGNLAERIGKVVGQPAKAKRGACVPETRPKRWAPGQMVVGRSKRMLEVMETARRAAAFPVTILLLGESGTGKGQFAHWIHRVSDRAPGPFVAVNLAAIPSDLVESSLFGHKKGAFTGAIEHRVGKFAQAQSGTLLLDEISELKLELQPKLLRVLQECEFERVGGERTIRNEARIIAATNQDIHGLVEKGGFRADLLYRLNVITITLPPLRDRREDIPDLVRLFLAKFNSMYGRSLRGLYPEALEALMEHSWPGNIRELEHAIQRAVIVAGEEYATIRDLFDQDIEEGESLTTSLADRNGTLEDLERQYIEEILLRTDGHQGQAAGILGIDRKTLYNKIMKYGLRRSLEQNGPEEQLIGKISKA